MSAARFGRKKKENAVPEIKAYAPGIYARSEELVQATRDLDRGRTAEEAVEEQRLANVRAFVEIQRKAGLDYFSDGLLNWQDIFRPFDESAEGLRPGPLRLFFNTNTFYRAPAVEAEIPKLVQPLSESFFRIEGFPRGRWVATLPSPYSLAEQAAGEIEPRTVAETILGPQIRWLADNGCAYLVLHETALFSRASGASYSYGLSEALEALAGSLPIALQLPLGDAGNILGELIELDVDAVGVDFYATDASSLPRPFPKTLLAGVIDARNSLLEEAEAVADFARSLLEDMDEGTQLHLVPNGDLQFVPERIAREKVIRLRHEL